MKKINFKLHRLVVMLCTLECTKAVINVTLTGTTERHVCKGQDVDFKWTYDDSHPDKDFITSIYWHKYSSGYFMRYDLAQSNLSITSNPIDYSRRIERTFEAGVNDIGMRLKYAGSTSVDDDGTYYVALIVDKPGGDDDDYYFEYREQGVQVYVCVGVDDTFPLPSLSLTYDETTQVITCSGPSSLGDTTFAIFDPSMNTVVESTTDTTISKELSENRPGGTYRCKTYCTKQGYNDKPIGPCLASDATLVMPVDGGWGDWTAWTACSLTCDNGTQTRNRKCDNPAPISTGDDCTGPNDEIIKCFERSCPAETAKHQPEVDTVWPTFGPQSGGTYITVRGQYLPGNSRWRVHLGPKECTMVYVNTTVILAHTLGLASDEAHLLDQKLPLYITINNSTNLTSNAIFTYRKDPVVERVYPKESIVSGGTLITADGSNLNSVVVIKMETTIVLKKRISQEPAENNVTRTVYVTDCEVRNATQMICVTASIELPAAFIRHSEEIKRKREVYKLNLPIASDIDAGHNRRKRQDNPQWVTHNGDYTLEVYIGFRLDGVDDYTNFTPITIHTEPLFIENGLKRRFTKDIRISFKGEHLDKGVTIYDYNITIGSGTCTDMELLSNTLSCLPPQTKPTISSANDPQIIIHIGLNVDHFAGHLIYPDERTPLYVWILAGVLPAFVIIVVVVTSVVCFKKRHNST